MTFVGTVLLFVVNVGSVGIAYGRLRQGQMDAKEENNRRFDRLEKAVGITDGNAGLFVPRRECYIMEQNVRSELEGIKARLAAIELILGGHKMGDG